MTHSISPVPAGANTRHFPETRVTHVVFPGQTNHHGTLFGGEALSMMDSAAFIAATRHCRRKVVTRHLDAMQFTRPIPQGTLVELVARVVGTGRSSMTVRVDLFIEDMYSDRRDLGCSGTFVLVALDADGQPTPVPPLPESPTDPGSEPEGAGL